MTVCFNRGINNGYSSISPRGLIIRMGRSAGDCGSFSLSIRGRLVDDGKNKNG